VETDVLDHRLIAGGEPADRSSRLAEGAQVAVDVLFHPSGKGVTPALLTLGRLEALHDVLDALRLVLGARKPTGKWISCPCQPA